jgi:hypothetical protein
MGITKVVRADERARIVPVAFAIELLALIRICADLIKISVRNLE